MNGIKLNKPKVDLFAFKEREDQLKKALSLKFLLLFILSHAFSYMAFYQKAEIKVQPKKQVIRKFYKRLTLPLTLYTEIKKSKQTKISIFSENNKLLIRSAFLINKIQSEEEGLENNNIYLVEIHQRNISKITNIKESNLKAYPFIGPNNIKTRTKKRRHHYEIIL